MVNYSTDHWAYFGDGNAAQILDSRDYVEQSTGIRMVRFVFIPSQRLEAMYDIMDEQDEQGAIVREFPATDVLFLERGVHRTRAWIYRDFEGGETVASRRSRDLTEALSDTERLLRSAEAAKNRAYEELRIEREHQAQALKQKTDAVREVARARGRVDGEMDMGMDGGAGGSPQ